MWARIDRNRCALLLNTLPFDHKSGSPESRLGLLPDINKPPLLRHSSKVVHKTPPPMPRRSGRPSPYPRFRPMIELFGCYPSSEFDLLVVGEVLPGQSLPAEHPPPRLLQVQPGSAFRDEHLLHSRMDAQPLPDRRALMSGEIVGNEIDLSGGIRLLDRLQQSEVAFGVA